MLGVNGADYPGKIFEGAQNHIVPSSPQVVVMQSTFHNRHKTPHQPKTLKHKALYRWWSFVTNPFVHSFPLNGKRWEGNVNCVSPSLPEAAGRRTLVLGRA